MDFVYVADVARAYLLAAESDITDDVFNVGTGTQTSLNALCALLLKLSGSSLQPEIREASALSNVQRRCAAFEKSHSSLGFKATVPLEQGLLELIRWRQTVNPASIAAMEVL